MNNRRQDKLRIVILHIIGWIVLLLLPPVISQNFERISNLAPIYYYTSVALLIPIYYLTQPLLLQKKIILFIVVIIGCFFLYFYLPEFVNDIFSDNISSNRRQIRFMDRLKQGLSVLFFITMFINVVEAANQIKKSGEKDKQARTEAELTMLKAQIDPHFLFNILNSIYYEALEKTDIAPKAIMSLSNLMRYILTDAKENYVTVKQEIQYIQGYLELQELRLPKMTKLYSNFVVDNDQLQVAPLLLIPFIENAIKFGVSTVSNTDIKIALDVKNNKLKFKVENKIFDNNKPCSTGIGLLNVKKRLDLIYPEHYSLKINNNEDRYVVKLEIDLNSNG